MNTRNRKPLGDIQNQQSANANSNSNSSANVNANTSANANKKRSNDTPSDQKTKSAKITGGFGQENSAEAANVTGYPVSIVTQTVFLPRPDIKIKTSTSSVSLKCNESSLISPVRRGHTEVDLVEESQDGESFRRSEAPFIAQDSQQNLCGDLVYHPTGIFMQSSLTRVGERPIDIDAGREASALHCTEYIDEIYERARNSEERFRPYPLNFLTAVQLNEISPEMRAILMDWLVDVTEEFKLSTETLFLTKAYVDMFMSVVKVARSSLQLVGVTCLLIASKYEEVSPPTIEDLIYISDKTYTRKQITDMELLILNKLKYNLAVPTVKMFLRRFQRAAAANVENRNLLNRTAMFSNYLAELTIPEYQFLGFKPSVIAVACVSLSLVIFNVRPWTATLAKYTTMSWEDPALQSCLETLYDTWRHSKRSNLRAVNEKYSSPRFLSVSNFSSATADSQRG
eukprot:TRINITY_DN649_c0_g1_i1.p1 TRINITY_DN649_c0_g1~~TRINITY_DN649_c0_g1_i1.p1  ORF type:complete len:456 (+),score=162.38 TRINITY_DN649_c0_g1_i1:181-1548(+)